VHLKGHFCCSQPFARYIRETNRQNCRIINFSSVSGLRGNFGQSNYGAAKAGVAGFTRVLALELKKYACTVNAISPGAATRMTIPLAAGRGRTSDPTDPRRGPQGIAPIVGWVASPAAQELTGHAGSGKAASSPAHQARGAIELHPELADLPFGQVVKAINHGTLESLIAPVEEPVADATLAPEGTEQPAPATDAPEAAVTDDAFTGVVDEIVADAEADDPAAPEAVPEPGGTGFIDELPRTVVMLASNVVLVAGVLVYIGNHARKEREKVEALVDETVYAPVGAAASD